MMRSRALALVLCLIPFFPAELGAVTCATQNVGGATLLVPYFRTSLVGSQGDDIPDGGVDTLVSVTNISSTGLAAQVTIWSKYGKPVLAFNLVMTGYDVAYFRMKDVLNGKLNVNPNAQRLTTGIDPCGINTANGSYQPRIGFGATRYIRFANPDPEDAARATAFYPTPAMSRSDRLLIWDSLDESGDVRSLDAPGANVLDHDNPACGDTSDGRLQGDLSGSVTIDVLNYCTTRFPDDPRRYANDTLATVGWEESGYTPNTLMGDVFYLDNRPGEGNVSGDSTPALVFDRKLVWTISPTFYARYAGTEAATPASVPTSFRFEGDGRMALGSKYTFRYLSDADQGLRSWATVWRSDLTSALSSSAKQSDFCTFRRDCLSGRDCGGAGTFDSAHALGLRVFDNDRNEVACHPVVPCTAYTFLQTQRIDLLDNASFNPGGFKGGYVEVELPGDSRANQAFVSVQHSGPGLALSVGHAATVMKPAVPCVLTLTPTR